jgi:hypothetical protein
LPSPDQPKDAPNGDQPDAKGDESGIDFSRYRMNPVQIEESQEAARAIPRRIGMYVVILLLIAAAVAVIIIWERLSAERSPLDSLDPGVRERAQELVDNILTRISSLQYYVYDVEYPTATRLRIFINPTVLEKSGAERRVTDEEVERATLRVVKEFHAYAPPRRHLTVYAFVVQHPALAEDQSPVAIGSYDPETDAASVKLTSQVPVPGGTGTGEAPPGEGHIGGHGGIGAPE